METTIVWFRRDLRLVDNPALHFACRESSVLIPLFIWDPDGEGNWPPGAASRWWLHQSLKSLRDELRRNRSNLVVRNGNSLSVLQTLIDRSGATSVFWNRIYEPAADERDRRISRTLSRLGVDVQTFNGSLLYDPENVRNSVGKPYRVFTPFRNALDRMDSPPRPLNQPRNLRPPSRWPASIPLGDLSLEPVVDWVGGLRQTWVPGRSGALKKFRKFRNAAMLRYRERRDIPGEAGTSMLSPHLHFGEISPREVWYTLSGHRTAAPFLRQIVWREFAHHLLVQFPQTMDEPLDEKFSRFPYRKSSGHLRAWQEGKTGYPIVDAGMRQLWTVGWMHNRVRMIVASFLVKDLMIDWREGARWFWDTLVDADSANNTLGWQWVAGCGADAAPFFRIYNPVRQGENFDPDGSYVRRWIPELARLPERYIHRPWEAPAGVLTEAQVRLGIDYPHPVVSHEEARERALAAYQTLRHGPGE